LSEFLQILRHANRNLAEVLNLLGSGASAIPITADDLARVLTELLRVGEVLQNKPLPEAHPELAAEIRKYRSQLEQLRALMPSLQAQLLVERARLEAERSHLEASSAWAEVCRNTR
jgi:hypothetical protein